MPALLAVHGSSPFGRQGRFGTIAVVGALHLGAVYALLVSLDVVPSPIKPPPPPLIVKPVDQTTPPKSQPLPPRKVTFAHPQSLPNPVPPIFKWVIQDGQAITPEPPPNTNKGATSIPPGPTLPLRALASTHTIPPYPPLGIRLAHEGTAKLRITVDEQGIVVSADLIQSSGHEELDAAAVAWVKAHWRYQPAMQDGHPVSATTNAVVTFRLDQARG